MATMNSKGIGDSAYNRQAGAKSNNAAIAVMQQMLQERCIAEPTFAIKMANPSKSMEGAVNHLCRTIQKSGLCVVEYNRPR